MTKLNKELLLKRMKLAIGGSKESQSRYISEENTILAYYTEGFMDGIEIIVKVIEEGVFDDE